MILQSLYRYAQDMRAFQENNPDDVYVFLSSPGMEWKKVPYRIVIKEDGTFVDLIEVDAKPQEVVGSVVRGNNIKANLLCDYIDYVLGVPKSDDIKDVEKGEKQLNAFVDRINNLPEIITVVNPIKQFYARGEHRKVLCQEEMISLIKEKPGLISFQIANSDGRLIVSDNSIKDYVNPNNLNMVDDEDITFGACLVTGKPNKPLTLIHDKFHIDGFGSSMINFQVGVGCGSYFKEQGLNAPISREASDAIVSALRHLSNKENGSSIKIGDTVYLFWTSNHDSVVSDLFRGVVCGQKQTAGETDPLEHNYKMLKSLKTITGSKNANRRYLESDERFYMIGIIGGRGRHSVVDWGDRSINEVMINLMSYLDDMNIITPDGTLNEEYPKLRPLWGLGKQLVPNEKTHKGVDNLMTDVVTSIMDNSLFPGKLQTYCLERVKREQNVTEWKASILKAYINRKNKRTNKKLVMKELDKTQTDRGYLAGRLLATQSKVQQLAVGSVGCSVVDKFYKMASVTPSCLLSRVMPLTMKHLGRAKGSSSTLMSYLAKVYEGDISEIIDQLDTASNPFSDRLTIDEQTMFALGFYQQLAEYKRVAKEKKEAKDKE